LNSIIIVIVCLACISLRHHGLAQNIPRAVQTAPGIHPQRVTHAAGLRVPDAPPGADCLLIVYQCTRTSPPRLTHAAGRCISPAPPGADCLLIVYQCTRTSLLYLTHAAGRRVSAAPARSWLSADGVHVLIAAATASRGRPAHLRRARVELRQAPGAHTHSLFSST
jgi:hypothetical protein